MIFMQAAKLKKIPNTQTLIFESLPASVLWLFMLVHLWLLCFAVGHYCINSSLFVHAHCLDSNRNHTGLLGQKKKKQMTAQKSHSLNAVTALFVPSCPPTKIWERQTFPVMKVEFADCRSAGPLPVKPYCDAGLLTNSSCCFCSTNADRCWLKETITITDTGSGNRRGLN